MWFFDVGLVPFLAMSLGYSAAALLAKMRYRWHNPQLTLFSKVSFTVFALALLGTIGWAEWYLYQRFRSALLPPY